MYFYTNGTLAWMSIPKNACVSWAHVFENLGWKKQDLYIPEIDLDKLQFFAFMQDPDKRHTAGVAQYLINENLQHLADDVNYQKLLTSACFDEHCYSIHTVIPESIIQKTTWIIMDGIYNYEKLAEHYLRRNSVIVTSVPRLNVSGPEKQKLKEKIDQLKQKYPESHAKLNKNFIGADLRLYRTQMLNQHQWKY